jgi:hypothetical protein
MKSYFPLFLLVAIGFMFGLSAYTENKPCKPEISLSQGDVPLGDTCFLSVPLRVKFTPDCSCQVASGTALLMRNQRPVARQIIRSNTFTLTEFDKTYQYGDKLIVELSKIKCAGDTVGATVDFFKESRLER